MEVSETPGIHPGKRLSVWTHEWLKVKAQSKLKLSWRRNGTDRTKTWQSAGSAVTEPLGLRSDQFRCAINSIHFRHIQRVEKVKRFGKDFEPPPV